MTQFRRISILMLALLVGLSLPLLGQESTKKGGLMLFGGIGLPTGAFGKTEGDDAGYAKKGWFAGGEVLFSPVPGFGIVLNGRYFQHALDDSQIKSQIGNVPGVSVSVGSYTGILPMGGIQLYTSTSIGLFVNGMAGYLFAKSPEITVSGFGTSQKSDAQSGKGFAYGFSAGIDIGNTLVVGGTYIASKPKFEVTTTVAGQSTTQTMEQQMNIIQVFGGIRF